MQILKTFIDGTGYRHKVGDPVPEAWDKPRLEHYLHHGMIGTPADPKKAQPQRRTPGPSNKKLAGPSETKQGNLTDAGGEQTTLAEVDSRVRGNDETDPVTLADAGAHPDQPTTNTPTE